MKEANFKYLGYACEVTLNNDLFRCGYVGVDKDHPAYNVYYNDLDNIEVHGGLTYGELKDDGLYYLGFDCAHGSDKPFIENKTTEIMFYDVGRVHRTLEFCITECKKMAKQLKEMEK